MGKEFLVKFKEACFAILPVVFVIAALNFIIPSFSLEENGDKFGPILTTLLISILPLILGTALFSIGAEKSIAKIGQYVGTTLTKRKAIVLLVFIGLLLGVLATLAEPDLSVLAQRISPNGPDWLLIVIASVGVGIFLAVALIRVILNKPLKYWLAMGYGLVFALACMADGDFFAIVFDAGGVTTGVVTVPFIIALGVSVSSVLGGKNAEDSSFGYSGLCSLGTVLSVMVFNLILKNIGGIENIKLNLADKVTHGVMFAQVGSYSEVGIIYLESFLDSLLNVAISMLPIALFFVVYNFFLKVKGKALLSIILGFAYTYVGLVLFLMGAESGFIPVASGFGNWFASHDGATSYLWLFLLVGVLLGFISMLAEPAVKVLANNVSEVSHGVISQPLIFVSLGAATALAIVFNIIRSIHNIDIIYFVAPLFILAIGLSFLVPEIYVGIAIDAAGVATGTMASCFFLPLFIAFTSSRITEGMSALEIGTQIMRNGFGIVGIMSIMPIIAVESVGLFAKIKTAIAYQRALSSILEPDDDQIIHLPLEEAM
ncbi:MAG: DUF1538 family protein [Bacilli bacterium]|nr:DUF1538 family protein [Bacilli bacterium]